MLQKFSYLLASNSVMNILLTDNGTQFTSKSFQTVCRLLGLKQLFTTAHHPSTNG
jgi:transposase InsO family protein